MPKEFILCAAILYEGIIVSGHRHGDCSRILAKLLNVDVDSDIIPKREAQGFLTSLNRFVDRREAFKIAKENKQIWHTLHDDTEDNILTSEDLY